MTHRWRITLMLTGMALAMPAAQDAAKPAAGSVGGPLLITRTASLYSSRWSRCRARRQARRVRFDGEPVARDEPGVSIADGAGSLSHPRAASGYRRP
jgi:hypothetical protein